MGKSKDKFLTSQQIEAEWRVWKETGQMTEHLGRYALLLATKLTGKPQFSGYPRHIKEDMISDAVAKILKNLHNLDPQKGSLFAYWTQIAWTAFIDHLSKHYKDINRRRELLKEQLDELQRKFKCGLPMQDAINNLERLLKQYEPPRNDKPKTHGQEHEEEDGEGSE